MGFLQFDREMQELIGIEPRSIVPVSGEVLPPDTGTTSAMVGGAYEGADRFSRETALWNPSHGSADSDILPDKEEIDARVRDLQRNDAYAKSGASIHKDNIVGAMFVLNSKPEFSVLGLDEKWAEEFQQEVESKFTLSAESPSNWLDASGINTFTGLVRMAVGMDLLAGEVLATAEWIDDDPLRPFGTAIQMVDPDRLSNPPNVIDSRETRAGVKRNYRGAPIGYHIRRRHPSDFLSGWNIERDEWKYVEARKPWGRQQVIHIYDQVRPEQTRGISSMVAALSEMRMGKQFRNVMLQNAVVNATYAATIESNLPSETVFAALGGGKGNDAAAVISKYMGGFLSAIASYENGAKNNMLNGVRVPHLPPGTKLNLQPAGQGGPLGTEFEQSMLRYLAANLDVSYEQLSRDYSKTNYSSVRAAMNESFKGMQSRKRNTADRFATAGYHLWLEEMIATKQITSMPRNAPNFWEGLNREAYGACEWIGASRGQIDELKETQAAVLRIKNGLSTREDELARLGKDWRKTFPQLEREEKEARDRGLNFNKEDKMMNATTGAPRDKNEREETADDSEDNSDA